MPTNNYRTKDLAESATLLTLGQKIIDVERIDRICWFVFADSKKCQKIANQFWYDQCLVDAKTYYDSIVRLKNRIFSS
ncbi:MAG: DUF5659 domain-containing protein [Candidatus Shapirobacteria bacterium]|nr:DUF5659 domain-containing protein [Candidatus Shapirobacteria bacterium]